MKRAATALVMMVLCAGMTGRPAAAATEVFSGWILSTDRNRVRMRIRTPGGDRRVVWIQPQTVWRRGSLVGRKILKPGQRVLVTAKRGSSKEWKATRVQVM